MQAYTGIRRISAEEKRKKLAAGCKRAVAALVRRLPCAAAFFLLSLAQCFYVPSPYAVCCLAALARCGVSVDGAGIGLAAGVAFRAVWGQPLDLWQPGACLICFLLMRVPWKKDGYAIAYTGIALLFRALPGLLAAEEARGVILNAAGVLLGTAAMPALLRCGRIIRMGFRELNEDDMLCLMLPCLFLIAGAGRISLFRVNLGYLMAGVWTLAFSWALGMSQGMLCGLGSGIALLLSGQHPLLLIELTFAGLMASLARGKNRLMAAGFYLLATVTAAYLVTFSFQTVIFLTDGAAALLFCLTPGKWMKKMIRFLKRARWSQPKENAYTRWKMQRWVRAIDRISDALPYPRIAERKPDEAAEAMGEMLCAGCEKTSACWDERYACTKEGLLALANISSSEGDELPIINQYFNACPRIARLPAIIQRMAEENQDQRQRALCAEYEREMLRTHLTALSQAAQLISLEGTVSQEEAWWISETDEALSARRFPGKTAFVKKTEERMTVCIQCDSWALRPDTEDQLVKEIGLRLHVKLRIRENRGDRLILEEETPLQILTGTATACAAREMKNTPGIRNDNGDAVLVKTLDGGRQMIALSDGMGHGTGAQDESRKTLELLSLCLDAGYTRKQAMTAVNGSMLSAAGGEKFATVDLCMVDLWSGEAVMNKLGACESYLIRGQRIERIEGEALPLGIIERIAPMEHSFTMAEGDMLLLMTDGISDAFPEEEDIPFILRRDRHLTPQQIADSLLREALIQYGGLPGDDMTVLCARVEDGKRKP